MNLKQILPIETNYKLRHFREWGKNEHPDYITQDMLNSKKRVFFLDAPAYGNLGDQAIAYAMETFVARTLPDYTQIEITEDKLPSCLQWLKNTVKENDLICLTGGGNMGVMYQRYESVRRLVLKTFPHNPIIIFPQTFDYGESSYVRKELNRAKSIYGAVLRLVLCARDEGSYERMKENFPGVTIVFCPDIVLSLDYRDRFVKTGEVGICLRDDAECVVGAAAYKKLAVKYPESVPLSTTDGDDVVINFQNRKSAVEKKLQEFGSKKLIVTDRLHGTIFAFITGTPVIALPNSNGKVERVCRYLSPCGNVIFVKNIDDITEPETEAPGTVMDRFGEIADAIKCVTEG